jgi:hypothetical protein
MGWVVSVTPRPRFTPGERTPDTHCTRGWVGPRAGLDTEARGKILCPRRGSNPDRSVVQPVVRHYTAWATPEYIVMSEEKLTAHLHLVPMLRNRGAVSPPSIRLYGLILPFVPGTSLPYVVETNKPTVWWEMIRCVISVVEMKSVRANKCKGSQYQPTVEIFTVRCEVILFDISVTLATFGGLARVVSVDPWFASSNPDDGFLRAIKIRSTTFSAEEVKLSASCRKILRRVKEPYR